MAAITQVITTLTTAPDPATMTRDQFNTAAAASVLAQKAMVPELNTWAGQVNAIASTAVGDVATAIGAAAADTISGTDEFPWRKSSNGLLKKTTFTNALTWFRQPIVVAASSAVISASFTNAAYVEVASCSISLTNTSSVSISAAMDAYCATAGKQYLIQLRRGATVLVTGPYCGLDGILTSVRGSVATSWKESGLAAGTYIYYLYVMGVTDATSINTGLVQISAIAIAEV